MRVGCKRRRRARVLLAIALVLAMLASAGCGVLRGGESSESFPGEAVSPPMDSGPAYSDGAARDEYQASQGASEKSGSVDSSKLIVRTKSMLVRVEEVEKAVDDIRALASVHGGSIESLRLADEQTGPVYREGVASDGRALAGYVTVRVPVAKFDAFVDAAAKLGKVLRHSEDASDVTQQHVDLKARLENLRAEEERLREMFDRATKVSDMLDVERELSRVRGEAEAMQAQIESLEKQAALSTVTLELVEPEPIVRPEGVDWGVADAFTEGLRSFVSTLNGMIVVTMGLAPLAILIALIVLVLRPVLRRRRRAREQLSATAGTPEDDPASL